jgi:U3 small nucleolar RNA-associated protein 19
VQSAIIASFRLKSPQISSLQILFSLLKHLSSAISQTSNSDAGQLQFHVSHFHKIISGLLVCPASTRSRLDEREAATLAVDVKDSFLTTWLNVYDDVRWFFLRDSA